ncbi:MAG: ABC transporter ATP-binding protein [bacterium]
MTPLVEIQNLSKTYGTQAEGVSALQKVSFKIAPGEFTALMGPSGCGKSTLLQLVGGLEAPTEGRIFFEGRDLAALSDLERSLLRRSSLGFIFQFFNLLPTFNALENVELPLLLAGEKRKKARVRAESLLEKVGLTSRAHHRPGELSGGEQQRVAVARALVHAPKLLLADEPTGNLDSVNGQLVLQLLRQVAAGEQCAVLMVTHSREAADLGDTLILLKDGRVTGLYPRQKNTHG